MDRMIKRMYWLLAFMALIIGGNAYLVTQSTDAAASPWRALTQELTHPGALARGG